MNDDRNFDVSSLVGIHSGILLGEFETLHRDIERLAGFPVWTHQLPRLFGELRPELEKHLPWLAEVSVPEGMDRDGVTAFVVDIAARYGEWHELPVLLPEVAERSPLDARDVEAIARGRDVEIISVVV